MAPRWVNVINISTTCFCTGCLGCMRMPFVAVVDAVVNRRAASPRDTPSTWGWVARCNESGVHTGHIVSEHAGASGNLPSTVQSATWAFSIEPQDGWGPRTGKQAATAGWLASLPVFEPHWQVLLLPSHADMQSCFRVTFKHAPLQFE